jgi:beta-galactosidase
MVLSVYALQPTNFTSIKPGTVWLADDSVHIDCHGGNMIYSPAIQTYFWYGEHRGTPAGIACYSSRDLYNWKNEGIAMAKGSIAVLERPKVVYNSTTKKYVMWFHYDNSSYTLAHLGVATSDSIKGPFTLVTHFRPNGHQSRDIGMYSDDNGKVYIIYAADSTNVTIRLVELTSDYSNVSANDTNINAHCEGPGMLKVYGTYYLMTSKCSGWTPNQATYYKATNINGPYVSKGDPCIGDSNHTTFTSQPSFIMPIPGNPNAFMYMGDRWNTADLKSSRYVFLPITITPVGIMQLPWLAQWNTSVFGITSIGSKSGRGLSSNVVTTSTLKTGSYSLYDVCGKKLFNTHSTSSAAALSHLSAGVYFVVRENGVSTPVVIKP